MNIASIRVFGTVATATVHERIPAGIVGATIRVSYDDPAWDGLTKTVIFKSNVTKDVITNDEIITIPAEVIEVPGSMLQIGFYGISSDGKVAIPTIWLLIGTAETAADPSGDTSTDPSLPVWAQLQAQIDEIKESSDDVDLEGYATEEWVQAGYQPKGNYLTEHQDISGKLDADKLPEVIDDALTQAKETGMFDGAPGAPGDPGVYTLSEGESIDDAPDWAKIVVDPYADPVSVEMVATMEDGTTVTYRVFGEVIA